jgi:hypothetical protein
MSIVFVPLLFLLFQFIYIFLNPFCSTQTILLLKITLQNQIDKKGWLYT